MKQPSSLKRDELRSMNIQTVECLDLFNSQDPGGQGWVTSTTAIHTLHQLASQRINLWQNILHISQTSPSVRRRKGDPSPSESPNEPPNEQGWAVPLGGVQRNWSWRSHHLLHRPCAEARAQEALGQLEDVMWSPRAPSFPVPAPLPRTNS